MDSTASFFLGPIWSKIIDKLFEYLQDQLRWQAGMKDELERLREIHPKIQAVVFAANQADIIDKDPALNKWIWQLRDAIDEADDLLDDFEYMRHAEQLASNSNTQKDTNWRPFKSFIVAALDNLRRFGKRALQIDPYLAKLQKVVQKLDRVSAEVTPFLHLIQRTQQEQQEQLVELHQIRETGSLPTTDLIGRAEVKDSIMQWLKKPSNEEHQTQVSTNSLYNNISLLSIVGHGGMGKTTLLQHVYEEDEITKEFDLKMWVCVSDNFDVKKVIAGLLQSLTKKKHDLDSLEALQESLKCKVKSKKFLLVLDDIWEENEEKDKNKWEKVIATLAGGALGSKILITTRMDSVTCILAKVIRKEKATFKLEGLQEEECLQLLNTHAFAGVKNLDDHKKLRSIASELVKKLFRSPLAAKVMGGVLNSSLDERHWRKVLNSSLGQNDIFPILKLSYVFLPKHLQNCFSFCSIFPQDYEFEKFDLVRMWIAVGFIQTSGIQEETLEDIGERYFDVLLKKSFFDINHHGYYKMHDLLHELAQFVSKQECFRDVGDKELLLRTPETIRHMSIKASNLEILRKMGRFKNLRTLCIYYDKNHQDCVDTFNEILKLPRSIRLLDIKNEWWSYKSDVILEGIGCLMHLRFLRYNFDVTQLPRSISKLYHLQFIIRNNFSQDYAEDGFFPRDMHNLSKLRYMNYPCLNFSGIGELVFLQQLQQFYVENEIGYRIEELKHMNDLCILRINQLENMRDAAEAFNAELCYKRKLTKLTLDWGCPFDSSCRPYCLGSARQKIVNTDFDESVFDNLQPHKYLKELYLKNYMGVRSAVWMKKSHLINNLEEIELCDCFEWKILPPFGHLPFLKILKLAKMPKVIRLDNKFSGIDKYCDFPSLEKLQISELEALEDWFDASVECLFPRLTKLILFHCPNLQELPYLPPKLETLIIENIGWKTLNCCTISKSISLQALFVNQCQNITFISMVCEMGTHAMLKQVNITDCPNLITLKEHQEEVETDKNYELKLDDLTISDPSVLQMEPLKRVTSIKNLTVESNDKLISFSFEAERWFMQISSSVHFIKFWNLKSLQSLPSSLTSFSSLETLCLRCLSQLQELPGLPASMKKLELDNLDSLQCLPSSLSAISSLKNLHLQSIPLLKILPELPAFLCEVYLISLDNLDCLPCCLSSLSSLIHLSIDKVPLIRELPNLPASIKTLQLYNLDSLQCLPSSLSAISSLIILYIKKVPLLRELPNLPLSLKRLNIRECDPELMKCYKKLTPGF